MKPIAANRFVRRIASEVGQANPFVAIARIVEKYRQPLDSLEEIARRLGAAGITTTSMTFDGGIFEGASGFAIKLNSGTSPRRRRFTLAHEIAHLILDHGNARGARRSHANTELEQACDAIAAQILMPLDEFIHVARGRASTASLLAIADHFGVSPQAAAVRVRELGLWSESVGQWSWDGKGQELWFVGTRLWPEKTIHLPTFELAVKRGNGASAWEWIEGDGERESFPAFLDVRKLGRDKVYLLAVIRKASANDLGRLKTRNFGDVDHEGSPFVTMAEKFIKGAGGESERQ